MAPKKQQPKKGAPPAPTAARGQKIVVRVPVSSSTRKDGKPTRKEKSLVNKAVRKVVRAEAFKAAQQTVHDTVRAYTADWPLKPAELGGRDDPSLTKVPVEGKRAGTFQVVYTDELDDQMFELICTGVSLRKIATLQGMPGLSTMLRWLADDTHKFSVTFSRARRILVPLYEDTALDAAITANPSTITVEKEVLDAAGNIVTLKETRTIDGVDRSRLTVAGYQWALSHLQPHKHGRNVDPEAGKPNEQLRALFDALKIEAE